MTTMTTPEAAERTRQNAWQAAFKAVSKAWGRRLSPDTLKTEMPALYANLEAARAKLDASWVSARAGLVTQGEFAAALTAWQEANCAAAVALKAVR